MAQQTARVLVATGGIIAAAALAAYLGVAHSCEGGGRGTLAGRVTITPKLAAQVSPRDVLFVIVRRPQGPPRPIAVRRIDSPQFPVMFEITNEDVMVQGAELKGMVDVVARVDKDGRAGPPQSGDLEGHFAKNPTLVGARDVEIVIDKMY